MFAVLAFGYEFLTEFVPFLIVMLLLRKRGRNSDFLLSKRYFVLPILFALYIMAVFHVTGAGTIYEAENITLQRVVERLNLIPFSDEISVAGYLLNAVMLVPFGFLVPLMWKPLDKLRRIALSGFGFSALIEASQLLNHRGTDVDDLIMNTLGVVIGFALYKVWDRLSGSAYQMDRSPAAELPAYILAIYLGRCLLFDYVGLIDLVYGF